MKLQGLYLIADTAQLTEKNVGEHIAALIETGVSIVQLRDKRHCTDKPDIIKGKRQLARTIQAQCRIYNIPFIVNDDVVLAKAIDADGVHLGQGDMDVQEARRYLGPNKYIGVSCYASMQRALQAQRSGADYVAFGTIFRSATKPQARCLGSSVNQSLQALKKLSTGINVPICAIGGITPVQSKKVLGCGVQMIAVAAGILMAANPLQAVKHYRAAWL